MKPILKWAGGKTRLLPELIKRVPPFSGRYFEPFLGGGALFFHLEPQRPAIVSDLNDSLIQTYWQVAHKVEALIRCLQKLKEAHSEAHYYSIRDCWNRGEGNALERAALFIYLNKTCYNGLWRVNRANQFNVPVGRYKNPQICDETTLRNASRLLRRTTIVCQDFTSLADYPMDENDFVYFDPPYQPLSASANFTAYTPGGFGPAEQRELALLVRKLHERNCQVMVSNHDTPEIRDLYQYFHIQTISASRAINSDSKKRGKVGEVIITN